MIHATPGNVVGRRNRSVTLTIVGLSALVIAMAYATAFLSPDLAAVGPWLMAVALPLLMISIMTLGATREGSKTGALLLWFGLVLVLVLGGFVVALRLPPDVAGGTLWLGLPRRAAIVIYGVGIVPLFVLPIAYALTFAKTTLSQDDLDKVRAMKGNQSRSSQATGAST